MSIIPIKSERVHLALYQLRMISIYNTREYCIKPIEVSIILIKSDDIYFLSSPIIPIKSEYFEIVHYIKKVSIYI